MANYYVRLDGNDANTGLGYTTALAWQTPEKALGATGIGSGDTLWIAPGDYRRVTTITVNGTYTAETFIKGDPTASQFPGMTAARVLISNRVGSDNGGGGGIQNPIIDLNSKNFMTWENIIVEQATLQRANFHVRTSTNLTFRKMIFLGTGQQQQTIFDVTGVFGLTRNVLFTQCIQLGYGVQTGWSDGNLGSATGPNYTYNLTVDRCYGMYITVQNGSNSTFGPRGIYIVNCYNVSLNLANNKGNIVIRNSYAPNIQANNLAGTGMIIENSQYYAHNWNQSIVNSLDDAWHLHLGAGMPARLFQIGSTYDYPFHDSQPFIKNSGTLVGTTIPTLAGLPGYSATGTPLTDIFENPWDGNGTPHIGAFNNYSATVTTVPYVPSERIESTISVPEGATSQTIYISLGWSGLTHTTAGLVLSYTRDRSASVLITPVAQTVSGAWVSGGFCEVSAVNQPGLYRLDVPNAAFVSGTTGVAVVGKGLTGLGISITHIRFSAPAPLMVRMGTFKVTRMRGNRVEDTIIDIVQGSEHDIELALEDADGVSIPLTGATTSVSIADSSGVVTSATTTTLYSDGGRLSFRLSTAYTNEPGTYKVYVNRIDNDGTQVFGPLRMVVRSL